MSASPTLMSIASGIAPIGTLWINAIRMTVIPLVVASLIVGVASSSDGRSIGSIGWRALVIFVGVLVIAIVFALAVGSVAFDGLRVSADVSASLRASGETMAAEMAERAGTAPSFVGWLIELVPVNPIKAAADGAMLPLIMFTLVFAVALLRVPDERRRPVVAFFQGVFDAMLVLVRWVLVLAPLGVFALALSLAARLGLAAIGALGWYIVTVSLASVVFMALVLYPMAVVLGGVPLPRFARAILPAQAVAFSARSSLASLPAMMEGSATRLHQPKEVTSFFLPLAATVFRAGAGIGLPIGVMFVARLYGVELSPSQLLTIALTVIVTSFSVPGIPGGSIIAVMPVMMATGIPLAGAGILMGADTIPDMFRTTTNVTGHMAASTVVSRGKVTMVEEPASATAA